MATKSRSIDSLFGLITASFFELLLTVILYIVILFKSIPV